MICALMECADYDYSESFIADVGGDIDGFRWLAESLKTGVQIGPVFVVSRFIDGERDDAWRVVFSQGLPKGKWVEKVSSDRLWWIHDGLTRSGHHADVLKRIDAEIGDRCSGATIEELWQMRERLRGNDGLLDRVDAELRDRSERG